MMSAQRATYLEKLRGTYWLIPALMVTFSIILSIVTTRIDKAIELEIIPYISWLSVNDAETARNFLSVIAGSMISTTGVTFSITIVSLVQASSQLGPRILSNFLRDRANQAVLGILTATYTFCLFTLKSIEASTNQLIPHLSIAIGTILTILSLGALVFFFHHISTSLQANYVISQVGAELQKAIKQIYPEIMDFDQDFKLISPEDIPTFFSQDDYFSINSKKSGYLQAIDNDTLIEIAQNNQLVLKMELRVGEYTSVDSTVVSVWPKEQDNLILDDKINGAILLGDERLRLQDIYFHIEQLVDIAIRALSPAINDPFTAIACIDQLTSGAIEIFKRSIAEGFYYDEEGVLRLITKSLTFTEIIDTIYDHIRRNSRTNVTVNLKLFESIKLIAPHIRTKEQILALKEQADTLIQDSRGVISESYDLKELEMNYSETIQLLNEKADIEFYKF